RVDEVVRLAARFPDAHVRLIPDLTDEIGDRGEAVGLVAVEAARGVGEMPPGQQQLTVDVELDLLGRTVAPPHGPGASISGKRQRALAGIVPTVEAIERLQAGPRQLG